MPKPRADINRIAKRVVEEATGGRAPLAAEQFRAYQDELVGPEPGGYGRLARLIGTSEIGVKRYATGGRPVPEYIAQCVRAMVLLRRAKKLKNLCEMP